MSEAEEKTEITKSELEHVLQQWSDGILTAQDVHDWAENNYFPLTQTIGTDAQGHTRDAMTWILNELDMSIPRTDTGRYALGFLNGPAPDFAANFRTFIEECFGEINDERFASVVPTYAHKKLPE